MATSIDDLKRIGAQEQTLPPFADGTPFVAKLKKVSIIDVARTGRIPNPLIKSIMQTIENKSTEKSEQERQEENDNLEQELLNDENASKSLDFMMAVVETSLVSPTYKQIQDCGVSLTDEQIFAIFSYALGDMSVLSSFR